MALSRDWKLKLSTIIPFPSTDYLGGEGDTINMDNGYFSNSDGGLGGGYIYNHLQDHGQDLDPSNYRAISANVTRALLSYL